VETYLKLIIKVVFMKRKYIFILTLIFIIISFGKVNATEKDERQPFEKGLFDIGYKAVEEALYECENFFTKKIALPYKIPPVQFTHYFGRCNKDYGINNTFEVLFLNENMPINHYSLTLRPKKHAIKLNPERINKTIKLDNGIAIYVTHGNSNNLIFEKEDWQYFLGIDKRISKQVPLEELVEIANSIY
jgi:hypothetical protein